MAKTASSPGYRLCPTCGTRVGAAATKCLVCGADLGGVVTGATGPARAAKPGRGSSLNARPISLTTVLVIGIVIVLLSVGGVMVGMAAGAIPNFINPPTATQTATVTPLPTLTYTPTPTETPVPTATPLPPLDYVIQSGDTCIKISLNNNNVSVASIISANSGLINPECSNLVVGATIKVPQPTPTATPLPTATLSSIVVTQVPRATYTVKSGDTLAGIARFYGLTLTDLLEVNGLPDANSIREGQVLIIPLERVVTPGPTPTATEPPPYPAPNPLRPRDGESFPAGANVTLQWTSVGALRPGEFYQVVIEDVTCNCARIQREVVTDTKYILPAAFAPQDGSPHIYRWSVTTVRQRPGSETGQPAYDSAGVSSPERSFVWVGSGLAPTTSP